MQASIYATQFLTAPIGLLSIFIDDLRRPLLTVPLSLNNTIILPDGKCWVGVTAATGEAHHRVTIQALTFSDEVCPDDCNTNGSCKESKCECDAGWRGPACESFDNGMVQEEETLPTNFL